MTGQRKALYALSIAVFLTLMLSACSQDVQRGRVPSEVQEVVTRIGEQISQERYDQIYNESSARWKQEVTLDKSNENSGGPLKGHVFILSYRTRFERGDAGETFTLVEENGSWLLARYLVNSTALKQ